MRCLGLKRQSLPNQFGWSGAAPGHSQPDLLEKRKKGKYEPLAGGVAMQTNHLLYVPINQIGAVCGTGGNANESCMSMLCPLSDAGGTKTRTA